MAFYDFAKCRTIFSEVGGVGGGFMRILGSARGWGWGGWVYEISPRMVAEGPPPFADCGTEWKCQGPEYVYPPLRNP